MSSSSARGFLTPIKATVTEAMKAVFTTTAFPDDDFQNMYISIEYPVAAANYPAIWVDFIPGPKVGSVGIGHFELSDPEISSGTRSKFRRWQGNGSATYTVAALSSLQRDRLHDEVLTILAFDDESAIKKTFSQYISQNEYIALTPLFDSVESGGMAATPGTPWGSLEIMYEATLSLNFLFEFVSDSIGRLQPIETITVIPFHAGDANPELDDANGVWY